MNRLYDLDIGLIVLEKRVPVDSLIMPACVDWRGDTKPSHDENGVVSLELYTSYFKAGTAYHLPSKFEVLGSIPEAAPKASFPIRDSSR